MERVFKVKVEGGLEKSVEIIETLSIDGLEYVVHRSIEEGRTFACSSAGGIHVISTASDDLNDFIGQCRQEIAWLGPTYISKACHEVEAKWKQCTN